MRTIKGFDHELKCRGFQFEVGKTYTFEGDIELCVCGFHALRDDVNPLKVFEFYPPSVKGKASRYCIVDIEGEPLLCDHIKVCGNKITIIKEVDIRGYVKEWMSAHYSLVSGENHSLVSGGNCSQVSRDCCSQVSAGGRSQVSAGDHSQVSGGYDSQVSAGDRSVLAGKFSAEGGKNCVIAVRGVGCKVKGGIGSILVIAEENTKDYTIKAWKAVVVDGKKVKADTWYCLKEGELVEAVEV